MVGKRSTDNQYGHIVAKVQEKWAKRSSLAPLSKSYMQEKQVDFRLSGEVGAGEVILDIGSAIMWTRFWRMERKWDTWFRYILTSLRASLPVLKWIGWRLGVLFE